MRKDDGVQVFEMPENKEALLKSFDNDWDFFKESVESFVDEHEQLLLDIKNAISDNQGETLKHKAHELKGMLRIFGAENIADFAVELEKKGNNADINDASDIYKSLASGVEQLIDYLTKSVEGT